MSLPTVIVLASGHGKRFTASGGTTHKLQARLVGKTVLQHTLDAVRASGLPWHLEDGEHSGMGDSIAAAVQATWQSNPATSGWLILPGDLPLVHSDTLRAIAAALQAGAPILCDARMVSEGITRSRLPADNAVICTLNDPAVREMAQALSTTRSAAALELWRPHLAGAVVAIGNAPTALFHLLNMLQDPSCPRPAAIIGCPVGFVGAAESKAMLAADSRGVPFVIMQGRRGGSAMAAAAVNALATEIE